MNNEYDEKLLETVAFSNGCICSMELIQWEHTHFHPSGNLYPSQNDLLITKKLMQAGELLDIELLDHIIVGGGKGEYYSFHTHNLLLDKELQQKQKEQKTMER